MSNTPWSIRKWKEAARCVNELYGETAEQRRALRMVQQRLEHQARLAKAVHQKLLMQGLQAEIDAAK